MGVLIAKLDKAIGKWRFATEPFVDGDGEGVLISGRARLAFELFGCHVLCGPCEVVHVLA